MSVVFGETIDVSNSFCGYSERELEDGFYIGPILIFAGRSVGLAQLTVKSALDRGLTPTSKDGRKKEYNAAEEWKVRLELVDPVTGIWASAEFLKQLAAEAVERHANGAAGKKPSTQWGDLDWAAFGKEGNWDKLAGSVSPNPDLGREAVVSFFAAAQNDDRASGEYPPEAQCGFAKAGQGAAAFKDLKTYGLLPK